MTAHTTQTTDTNAARNTNDMKVSTRTLEFAVYVAAVLATIHGLGTSGWVRCGGRSSYIGV